MSLGWGAHYLFGGFIPASEESSQPFQNNGLSAAHEPCLGTRYLCRGAARQRSLNRDQFLLKCSTSWGCNKQCMLLSPAVVRALSFSVRIYDRSNCGARKRYVVESFTPSTRVFILEGSPRAVCGFVKKFRYKSMSVTASVTTRGHLNLQSTRDFVSKRHLKLQRGT